ncbi:Serine/threonine-protein kinase PrkC [Rubripirellula amarantea]|uniref:non-specific serine/threonine protein kinase n=1 Tax=Rubripirellula amarantea TaxID=2527999 RepID=A0A5C5WVU1_9BACT|nr:serine/threonine-protein kinase [Rubripirellula amarantea]TWT54379.1 Serine/threonine-protein kinase PrkC [Rubripirellula amarantea]
MNRANTACRPQLIDEFLSGDISPELLIELEEHLNECPKCDQSLLVRTANPDLWDDAKKFLTSNELERATAGCTIDVSSVLDPTDDPNMMGRFGGYEITGVIGRGGMGVVLKGHDVSLDRFVAIKLLNPTYSSNSAARVRFAREAQAAAAVVHDNVIAIYGVSEWNGIPFLVMPYIKGESLQQRIDRTSPMSIENTLEVSLQIARGLAAAHDQGLVHRDIKPANILMPSSVSRVLITDFGLARAADDASLTSSGVIAGTPQYMSPEQSAGESVDARTDLFSLGSVMFAMQCGHSPFRAETSYGTLHKVRTQQHRQLSKINNQTPLWLEQIVDRLLEKDPNHRFASASDLADHLEECLAHIRQPGTTVLPAIQTRKTQRKRLRSSWLFAVAGLIALSAISYFLMPSPPSIPSTAIESTDSSEPSLAWEVDDSDLLKLELELQSLIRETAVDFDD